MQKFFRNLIISVVISICGIALFQVNSNVKAAGPGSVNDITGGAFAYTRMAYSPMIWFQSPATGTDIATVYISESDNSGNVGNFSGSTLLDDLMASGSSFWNPTINLGSAVFENYTGFNLFLHVFVTDSGGADTGYLMQAIMFIGSGDGFDSSGFAISGSAINSANVTSYPVSFFFAGNLISGDIATIQIIDSTGTILSYFFTSTGGGETGYLINADASSLVDGFVTLSGNVIDSGGNLVTGSFVTNMILKDILSPTATLTSTPADGATINNGDSIAVTLTFNESSMMSCMSGDAITINNGTMTGYHCGSGYTRIFDVISNGSSPMTIIVETGTFSDNAGNLNDTASNRLSFPVNGAAPTATGYYSTTTWTNHDVVATITGFSEPITGLNEFTHTFTGNGIFVFTFQNLSGTQGVWTATVNNIDKLGPIVTLVSPTNGQVLNTGTTHHSYNVFDNTETVDCTFYWSGGEGSHLFTGITPGTGIYAGDLTNSDGIRWRNISCEDLAGNTGASDTWTFQIDTTSSGGYGITGGFINIANASNYPVNFVFSGALNSGDIVTIQLIDSSGTIMTYVSPGMIGGETEYTTNISGGSFIDGPVTLSGSVVDSLGNLVTGSHVTSITSKNMTTPSVGLAYLVSGNTQEGMSGYISVFSGMTQQIKSGGIVLFMASLNEVVSGFDASDITVSGGIVSNFTGAPGGFTFEVTHDGTAGTGMAVQVAPGTFTDEAGNPNDASLMGMFIIDTTIPTATLTSTPVDGTTINGGEFVAVTLTFNESTTMSCMSGNAVTITNGTMTGYHCGSGLTRVFDVISNGSSPMTIIVETGSFSDNAGNLNDTASNRLSFPITSTPLTGVITSISSGYLIYTGTNFDVYYVGLSGLAICEQAPTGYDVIYAYLSDSINSGTLSGKPVTSGAVCALMPGRTGTINVGTTYENFTGNTLYLHVLVNNSSGTIKGYGVQEIGFMGSGNGGPNWVDIYQNEIYPVIVSEGINNNLNMVSSGNVNNFTGLYFEKPGYGKISFQTGLDLANAAVQSFLENLSGYITMNNGFIEFIPTGSGADLNVSAMLTMYFDTGSDFVTQYNNPDMIVARDNSGNIIDSDTLLTGVHGACEVGGPCTLIFDTQHFTSFGTKPLLTEVTIQSSAGTGAWSGDTIYLSFTGSEALTGVMVTIAGNTAALQGGGTFRYASGLLITGGTQDTNIPFGINYSDYFGNSGNTITGTTDGSYVQYYNSGDFWQSTYTSIGSSLSGQNILNNFNLVNSDTVENFHDLFFDMPGLGRITFLTGLNLTDSGVQRFLQNLSSYIHMDNGFVEFTPTGSGANLNVNAQITMYFPNGAPFIGSGSSNNIVVRDSNGNITGGISLGDVICVNSETDYCYFSTEHFTSFEFRPYLTDVTIQSNSGTSARSGDIIYLSFTGSEALTGVTVTIAGNTANLQGTGTTRTASGLLITGGTEGQNIPFAINYSDYFGNSGNTITDTTDGSYVQYHTADTTPPTVSLTGSLSRLLQISGISVIMVTGTLSESSTTLTGGDIIIINGTISNFTGSGTGYTFTVTPITDGAMTIQIGTGSFSDAAGNPNVTGSNVLIYSVDATPPTINITGSLSNGTTISGGQIVTFTATSSEMTSNFTGGDVIVTNGTLSDFNGGGTGYTFTVTPITGGTMTVQVGTGTFGDIVGNPNATSSNILSYSIDATAPTAYITYSINHAVKQGDALRITANFDEDVLITNAPAIRITYTGNVGIASTFGPMIRIDATHYYYDPEIPGNGIGTGNGTGTITLDCDGVCATDLVGNTVINIPTSGATFIVDNTAPTATGSYSTTSPTNQDVTVTLTGWLETLTGVNFYSHIFTENDSFEFTFSDLAGNTGNYTAMVNWIDKTPPSAPTITNSNYTTSGVAANTIFGSGEAGTTVLLYKNGSPVCGGNTVNASGSYAIVSFGGSCLDLLEGANSFVTTLTDAAGNVSSGSTAVIITKDTTAPTVPTTGIIYTPSSLTSGDVVVTLTGFSESITGLDPTSITFTGNGTGIFTFYDLIGNMGSATATVTWIDKTPVTGSITYSPSSLTNQNVTATISFNKTGVTVTNNTGTSKIFTSNNTGFIFTFHDLAGNTGSEIVNITRIDKTAATANTLGDGTSDYSLSAGTTGGLVFSELIANTGQIQSALTFGASYTPTYNRAGSTLIITANASGTSWDNDVAINVYDMAGNASNLLLIDSAINTGQLEGSGNVDVTTGQTQVVVSTNPTDITIPDTVTNATILVPVSTSGDNTIATVPAITLDVTTSISPTPVNVAISDGTNILAPSDWDGVIAVPTIRLNSSVTPTPVNGKTNTVQSVIEVGFPDGCLTFDKAVKLVMPGQKDKKVGYIEGGDTTFHPIDTTCNDLNAPTNINAVNPRECFINDGNDLVVRTYHFTKFVTYTQTTNSSNNGSNGGGANSLSKDVCPNGDTSSSFYDGKCSTGVASTSGSKQGNISGSTFSTELNNAYLYAFTIGITTMPTIQTADIEGTLIRAHMAKMMVNYAVKVLGKTPNTGALCAFDDIANESVELKGYIKLACQLGLMGIDIANFNPNGEVTRAEFGTVLSRALYGTLYNDGQPYYLNHLNALKTNTIITNTNPDMKELRGYVMLMLMRAK